MKIKKQLLCWGKKAKELCSKALGSRFLGYSIVQVYLISLLVNLVIEAFSRFSLWKAFGYLFTSPLIFLVNTFIISIVIAPSILSKRRMFFYLLTSTLWLAVGVVDFFLLHNRVTPFNGNDLRLIQDAIDVAFHYYTIFQLILIALLIVAVIALIIVAFFKFPKRKERVAYKKMLPLSLALMLGGFGIVRLGIATGVMAQTFPNIADAYHDYGLPYCFVCSLVDQGIDKPSDYSPEKVEGVISPLAASPSVTVPAEDDEKAPNVIFIQLESFFDPKRIEGLEFAEDPIPNFTALMRNYTSGFLTVPSISAGTANTEFEVLTGMNMADFGTGEYPYKTILKTHTCESIAYNLKALGYGTHAIHNNTATFYGRNVVYRNLGFDDFDSVELMQNVVRNELNWAKDEILYGEIITALDSTPGADLVFTVSVQGHGKYPDEDILSNTIELADLNDAYSDDTIYGLKYYISQLHEMDAFVGRLIEYLAERDEPTVLVLYGDHLPGFDFSADDLKAGELLQTEYVMWSNFEMEAEHRDLHAYQLSAYVMNRLNYHEGLVSKLHQKFFEDGDESYLEKLTLLSYDMLYGEMYCFDGENPYEPTDIVYGFRDVLLNSVEVIYDEDEKIGYLTVIGENFSPYTDIYINGERYKNTIYLNENEVFLPNVKLSEGDSIVVGMPMGDDGMLRESQPHTFTEADIINP
ncbi:MAG: sulfatase-like hydrolase/transferase [Lachnospiraceae bacterium]|nr:sulfatase-like hydrolase/transferase [Lachnospiraceae bacterium]